MFERLAGIVFGALICAIASAQSVDDRILELESRIEQLERRVEQIERQVAQPAPPARAPKSTSSQNWRSLRRGMTEDEVRSILGEPHRVDVAASYISWEYREGAEALFNSNGRLQAWHEPR